MGHDNNLRTQMNGYFENVFDSSVIIQIDGVPITSMNATDHVLFLTCHAFRHFTAAGFGIRQVLDILLFAQKYYTEIDWNMVESSLKAVRANVFFGDLIYIGNYYLEGHTRVRPQCGQLKPRMLKIQRFWAYILDFLYKYLDISS